MTKSTLWKPLNRADTNEDDADRGFRPAYSTKKRPVAAIEEALELFSAQFWYNEHKLREWEIKQGEHKLVTENEWDANVDPDYGNTHTIDAEWERARESAKRLEPTLGEYNCDPLNVFEWGFLAGKLSALSWVLGHEWDGDDPVCPPHIPS